MTFVSIPLAALESAGYLGLTAPNQKFLIDLYVLFHDCERFTICWNRPADYRQPARANLSLKITSLMDAGLLRVVGHTGPADHRRRVFAFTYPALETLMEAA